MLTLVSWKRWCVYKRIIQLTGVIAARASGHSEKTARPWLFFFSPFLSFFTFALGLSGSISAAFLEHWGFPNLCMEGLESLPVHGEMEKQGKLHINCSETGH